MGTVDVREYPESNTTPVVLPDA